MGIAGCTEKSPAPLDVGDHFPALTLEDLTNRPVAFPSSLRAEVSLVSIRTLGCRFCVSDFAELEKMSHYYRRDKLDITVINVGFDCKEVEDFLREKTVSFPVLIDPKMQSMHLTHTVILPVSYFLDQNGIIIARLSGGFSLAEVQSLLGEYPHSKGE